MQEVYYPGYKWMVEQIKKRCLVQPPAVDYPIWAWCQWNGILKRRDMIEQSTTQRKEKVVQLTIEIDDSDVLLSDYSAFHHVLYYSYLQFSEKDDEDFDGEHKALGGKWVDVCKHRNPDSGNEHCQE